MYTDRERLNESSLLEGDMIGKLKAEIGIMNDESSKASVKGWGGEEAHLRAQIVGTDLAMIAATTRNPGLKSYTISNRKTLDLLSNLFHNPRSLMTENHWRFHHKTPNGSMGQVVHITATDTNCVDLD
jgi:hypothetical protein